MNTVISPCVPGSARQACPSRQPRCQPRCLRATARPRLQSTRASSSENFSLAPASPQTPYGEMMAYYLTMEPRLFEDAVKGQFQRLQEEKEANEAKGGGDADSEAPSVALSSLDTRIRDVRVSERRTTVEDLMYMCIIAEFVKLGVGMLPRMDDYTAIEGVTLTPLLEGIHSMEAIDMVKGHLTSLMAPMGAAPPTASVKMAKIQIVQIYAASVMFGYFLRKVDARYQLARSLGMLPEAKEAAVSRLERLFSLASEEGEDSDPDSASALSDSDLDNVASAGASGASGGGGRAGASGKKPALQQYIDSFDRETMMETARIMSQEGANLLDRQSKALWGDVNLLQQEMQEVIGMDANSMEEVMKRAETAVRDGKVETVTMSVATQRRAVLEAVAYGTFLRDIENSVDQEYDLLTATPAPGPGPGPTGPSGPQKLGA